MPCDTATVGVDDGSSGGIVVDSVSIEGTSPTVGTTVPVTVSLSNTSSSVKEKTFDVNVNSSTAASLGVTLDAGGSAQRTLDVQVPNADTLTVSIGGKSDTVTTSSSGGTGGTSEGVFGQVTKFVQENPYKTAAGVGVVGLSLVMSGDDSGPTYFPRRR